MNITSQITVGKIRHELLTDIRNDKPIFLRKEIRLTPKGLYSKEKTVLFYRYSTVEDRDKAADESIVKQTDRLIQQEKEKVDRATVKKNIVNPFQVGDLFYDSWGYDQTNIDFFQIVGLKPRSVILRRIGQIYVEGSGGFMCEDVKPHVNEFIGEPFTRPLLVSKYPPYTISFNAESSYRGHLRRTTAADKHYQSHYA